MKMRLTTKKLFTTILIALFVMIVSSKSIAQAQSTSDLKDFKITIERTDNGLKMQSAEGSAWVDLGFSLANNKPVTINTYGMTRSGEIRTNNDPKLVDYLFTIAKTDDKIILKGVKGTVWKELSFSLQKNGKHTIDQFGMTE